MRPFAADPVNDFWAAVAALLAIVVPLALAWWLLGRPQRHRRHDGDRSREKMPR